MNFVDPHFFVFFPIFIVIYYILRGKKKQIWLLGGSYYFYAYFSVAYCSLLIASTLVDYILARLMSGDSITKRKNLVFLSILFNLGLLGFFKYRAFFWNELILPIGSVYGLEKIQGGLPPVGISFFTFQTMSYAIDVYRGKLQASRSFLQFAVYVSMFPQLVAGPIVRAAQLLPQIAEERGLNFLEIKEGLQRFIIGFGKKACIADSLAILLVDPAFADPSRQTPEFLCLAMLGYSFQIYFDFSGYSDMAIGIGKMMGFQFPENFRYPYQATSFSEFWQRWHITLSSWLRDYLYIPMGGNRKGAVRTILHLLITMLLGGLWHGASTMFILWGGLHGLWLVVQRIYQNLIPDSFRSRVPRSIQIFIVFTFVTLTWVPFRIDDSTKVFMFWEAPFIVNWGSILTYLYHLDWNLQLLLAICFVSHFLKEWLVRVLQFNKWPLEFKAIVITSIFFWLLHFYPETKDVQPFIYFQF